MVPWLQPARASRCAQLETIMPRAHALGLSVIQTRYAATIFGGAMAGLGGAYLSLAYTPLWGENMTAGRGWIALALVVFATWRPLRLVAGAYLFAMVTQLQFYGQDWGWPIASQFLAMAPYLATVVALVIISRDVQFDEGERPSVHRATVPRGKVGRSCPIRSGFS